MSHDDTCALVACIKDPRVRLERLPKNTGFCGGHNHAICGSSGEFILLVNPDTLQAYSLDYRNLLLSEADANGNLTRVTLRLPKGASLPDKLRAYVLLDVFPAYQAELGTGK